MNRTSIEWTDRTWNPTRGCSRVSEGCRNCYAERHAARFAGLSKNSHEARYQPFHGFVHIVNGHPAWTGKVELIKSKLLEPLSWKKPARVFVNSMSDLFHEALSLEEIDLIFDTMQACPQHTFQVLTKRAARMRDYIAHRTQLCKELRELSAEEDSPEDKKIAAGFRWPLPNVHLGVSVEDQTTADERIPLLLQTPTAKRFVSYEPALGPVNFTSWMWADRRMKGKGLDQIIVGGESGPGARPFDIAWPRNTIAQCKAANVAVFMKQVGAKPFILETDDPHGWSCAVIWTKRDGHSTLWLNDRKGGDMNEWPEDLRVRELI